MSTRLALCLLSLAGTFVIAPAHAQTVAPDRLTVEVSDAHAPAQGRFIGGYSVQGHSGHWVVEFFDVRGPDGVPKFSARRALNAFEGQEQEQRVDIDDCPALWGVMEALNNLAAPPVRVNNLRRAVGPLRFPQWPPGPSTSAPYYTVWGRSIQADGSFAQSRFSANTGPIADFGRFAEEQMASCWSNPAD